MPERVAVFLDYQNVHLTAHSLFATYGIRPETSLVHPLRVAECITEKRRIESELVSVRVFRGRPNPEHHPVPTAANDAQSAAWQRDPGSPWLGATSTTAAGRTTHPGRRVSTSL